MRVVVEGKLMKDTGQESGAKRARMGQGEEVREVWAEALEVCGLDIVLASAHIAAAADEGDIEGAAEALDKAEASGIPLDKSLLNSAIRTCWGPGKYRDKAARYFYGLFAKRDLVPDIVTFAALAGAFTSSPLEYLLWTYCTMKWKPFRFALIEF